MCIYGKKCYRTNNLSHLQEFAHPDLPVSKSGAGPNQKKRKLVNVASNVSSCASVCTSSISSFNSNCNSVASSIGYLRPAAPSNAYLRSTTRCLVDPNDDDPDSPRNAAVEQALNESQSSLASSSSSSASSLSSQDGNEVDHATRLMPGDCRYRLSQALTSDHCITYNYTLLRYPGWTVKIGAHIALPYIAPYLSVSELHVLALTSANFYRFFVRGASLSHTHPPAPDVRTHTRTHTHTHVHTHTLTR